MVTRLTWLVLLLCGCGGNSLVSESETPLDLGPDPAWDHCPSADEFVSPPPPHRPLTVEGGVHYCIFDVPFDAELGLIRRVDVHLRAGQYSLPAAPENFSQQELTLPMCMKSREGGTSALLEPGEVLAFKQAPSRYVITQTYALGRWEWRTMLELPYDLGEPSAPVHVSASQPLPLPWTICNQTRLPDFHCTDHRKFMKPCSFHDSEPRTFEVDVTFDGGQLTARGFELAPLGPYIAEASGRFNGQDFEQTSYFDLVSSFRQFYVFFGEIIGGVCGVTIQAALPFATGAGYIVPVGYTVNCAGQPIAPLGNVALSSQLLDSP